MNAASEPQSPKPHVPLWRVCLMFPSMQASK